MDGPTFDAAYYRDLQRRLRELLTVLGDRLLPDDRRMVEELIDVNECGLALETIVDALEEMAVEVDQSTVDEIARLAETMGLPSEQVGRRPPLGVG